ncbi:hypothetical protein EV1_014547 [Malus domestica]
MPFVCPDGAVVAYAWKRQLTGQVGASAVDRTRLALKAFTDHKRRFFPHLDDASNDQCNESTSKKQRISQAPAAHNQEDGLDSKTLLEVLVHKVAVIGLLFPSTFRAVVSLHPAGSIDPDATSAIRTNQL